MFVAQITMLKGADFAADAHDVSMALNGLLAALLHNGQVCGREFPVSISDTAYVATVLIPEASSLDAKFSNRSVLLAIDDLATVGLGKPSIFVAEDMDSDEACACGQRTGLILYTTYFSREPPLRCAACFRPVSLYRIPALRGDEYLDVLTWQSEYQACDSLQMHCGPLERAATRQMSRVDSLLSVNGLALCRRISELTKIPVYYYLYRYGARSARQERKRLCPSCGGEWLLSEPWHLFDFKCERCHLLSNIAWGAA